MTVLEARQKWIDYLLTDPLKAKGRLEVYKRPDHRCCLGHACHVLGATRTIAENKHVLYNGSDGLLPEELVKQLGMYSSIGKSLSGSNLGDWTSNSLAEVNDSTLATHKEIGEYLQTVIMGGPDTPFKEIEDGTNDGTN